MNPSTLRTRLLVEADQDLASLRRRLSAAVASRERVLEMTVAWRVRALNAEAEIRLLEKTLQALGTVP